MTDRNETVLPKRESEEERVARWERANDFTCPEHGHICSDMVRHVLEAYGTEQAKREVTDEMVARAIGPFYAEAHTGASYEVAMRAALEAALNG